MDLLSGMTNLEDTDRLLESLRELNTVLTLGQADIRAAPFISSLIQVLSQVDYGEAALLAARALNTILDIEPRCTRQLVNDNGLSILCNKLIGFQDVEVAEQCLNCIYFFAKHSKRRAGYFKLLLRADALNACTAFFDFFPKHMQVKALETISLVAAFVCDGSTQEKCTSDASFVLAVLPALHTCLNSGDEDVLRLTCVSLARLVLSYEKGRARWNKQSSGYSWHVGVVREVVTNEVTARLIQILRESYGGKLGALFQQLIFRLLACAVRMCSDVASTLVENNLVQMLQQRLSMYSRHQLSLQTDDTRQDNDPIGNHIMQLRSIEQEISNTLELIESMTPALPRLDTSADANIAQSKLQSFLLHQSNDKSSESPSFTRDQPTASSSSSTSNASHNASSSNDNMDGVILGDVWACPVCTFHNSLTTSSCEMCGQVCPEIQMRAEKAKSKSRPSVDALSEKYRDRCNLTIENVWATSAAVRSLGSLAEQLVHISAESCILETQVKALNLVSSISFFSSEEDLRENRHDGSTFSQSGCLGFVSSAMHSPDSVLVKAALRLVIVDLLRIPSIATTRIIREGILERVLEIISDEGEKSFLPLAKTCYELFHTANNVPTHSVEKKCRLCAKENDQLCSLEAICHRLVSIPTSSTSEQTLFDVEREANVSLSPSPPAAPCCTEDDTALGSDKVAGGASNSSGNSLSTCNNQGFVSHSHDATAKGRRSANVVRNKRRSISQPVGAPSCRSSSAAGYELESNNVIGRPEKKRKTFASQSHMETCGLIFQSDRPSSTESDRRVQWVYPLEDLKAILSGEKGATLFEMKKAGLVHALQLVLSDADARYVFFEVFGSETDDSTSNLMHKLFSLLHAEEKFQVQLLGNLAALSRGEHFVIQPSQKLSRQVQSLLDSIARDILASCGGDIYKAGGFTVVEEVESLRHDVLVEPLALVSDVQSVIWKHFQKCIVRAVLNAERAALLHLQGAHVSVLRPGSVVRRKPVSTTMTTEEMIPQESLQELGTVLGLMSWKNDHATTAALVMWNESRAVGLYRYGHDNKFDLEIVSPPTAPRQSSGSEEQEAWRRSLGEGVHVDLLDSDQCWKAAIVQSVVEIDDVHKILRVRMKDPATLLFPNQTAVPTHSRLDLDAVATSTGVDKTLASERWVLSSSPRLSPMGSVSSARASAGEAVSIETVVAEDQQLVRNLASTFNSSELKPGMLFDVKLPGTSLWFPASIIACEPEPKLLSSSKSSRRFALVHDLNEQSIISEHWVDLSSASIAPLMSKIGIASSLPLDQLHAAASTSSLDAQEILWLIQRCGALAPVKRQSSAQKKMLKQIKPGDTVFLPVYFQDRTNFCLEATVLSLRLEDEDESVPSGEHICLSFNRYHNIRKNVVLRDVLPTRPAKFIELDLQVIQDALDGKGKGQVLKCLVEKRDPSWEKDDAVTDLYAKVEAHILQAAAEAVAATSSSSSSSSRTRSRTMTAKTNRRTSSRRGAGSMLESNESQASSSSSSSSSSLSRAMPSMSNTRGTDGETPSTVFDILQRMAAETRSGGAPSFLRNLSRDGLGDLLRGRIPSSLRSHLTTPYSAESSQDATGTRLQVTRVVGMLHDSLLLGDFVPETLPLWVVPQPNNPTSRRASGSTSSVPLFSALDGEHDENEQDAAESIQLTCTVGGLSSHLEGSKMMLEAINSVKSSVSLTTPLSSSSNTGSGAAAAANAPLSRNLDGGEKVPKPWGEGCKLIFECPGSDSGLGRIFNTIVCPGAVIELEGSVVRSPSGALQVDSHFPSCTVLGAWVTTGKWYWEVQVLRPGLAQIGWASIFFAPADSKGIGCGDDQHSWAFDGQRKKLWNVESTDWGVPWKSGDVLGCAVEVNARSKKATISFSMNGSWDAPMGVAFRSVSFSGPAIRPVLTFNRSFQGRVLSKPKDSGPLGCRFDLPSEQHRYICDAVTLREWNFATDSGPSSRRSDLGGRRDMSISPVTTPRVTSLPTVIRAAPIDSQVSAILSLLMDMERIRSDKQRRSSLLSGEQSIHSQRLTQKFVLQIQDALSVCGNALPSWVWSLAKEYKFLLPLEARMLLFETTSFGISRAAQRLRQDNVNHEQETVDVSSSMSNGRIRSQLNAASTRPFGSAPQPTLDGTGTETEGRNEMGDENFDDDEDDDDAQAGEFLLRNTTAEALSEVHGGGEEEEEGPASNEQKSLTPATSPVLLSASSPTLGPVRLGGPPSSFQALSLSGTNQVGFGSPARLDRSQGQHQQQAVTVRHASRIVANVDGSMRGQIGVLRKQKAVVPRSHVLDAAMFLMQNKAARQFVLSVEFSGETGHGLGPTLEFFSLVCQELQRVDLELWRSPDDDMQKSASSPPQQDTGKKKSKKMRGQEKVAEEEPVKQYVFNPHGLWPKRLPPRDSEGESGRDRMDSSSSSTSSGSASGQIVSHRMSMSSSYSSSGSSEVKVEKPNLLDPKHSRSRALELFTFLGRFIGKSLQDRRLLDLPFSSALCKLILGEALRLEDMVHVDEKLGRSLLYLQSLARKFASLKRVSGDSMDSKEEAIRQQALEQISSIVEGMCLDFTVPGEPERELCSGGKDKEVTAESLEEYLCLVKEKLLVEDVREQVQHICKGLNEFFPVEALQVFSVSELASVLSGGGADDNWKGEVILRNITCKHGFDIDSPQIQDLVQVLSELGKEDRRLFMQFLTGSPRLPIGGFGELRPRLTVVRKNVPVPDEHLPSCSTCQVYLKLPPYSSRAVLQERMLQAIREGQGHFALD